MSLSVGIVGLPNVGKSTLFNALLEKQQALAANYPFATIEPNVGIVPVPAKKLPQLAEIVKTEKIVPATVEFVDIAGLVAGAAEGAGLGNKFLANIRETSFILHVVRAFADSNIIKEGSVDPQSDYQTIATELQLADLSTLEKQREPKGNQATTDNMARWNTIQEWRSTLDDGKNIRSLELNEDQLILAKELALLTAKAEMVALNVAETDLVNADAIIGEYSDILGISPDNIVVISAKLEEELVSLSAEEKSEYLTELGIAQSGLERLIQKAYATLGMQSFYTAGEKEVRAWTISQGMTAPQAAGVIHTDFTKNFIKARVCSFYRLCRSWWLESRCRTWQNSPRGQRLRHETR
ncbi:redox-regulated ATPase YchF [Candidatus Woesebacteria bacterium]|nr:redox-regulated ATPase YchF [Candidatus Woesebacteria bacterium]